MNMKFLTSVMSCAAVVLSICSHSQGGIIAEYGVFSTSVINAYDYQGNPAPHGLWTGSDLFGSTLGNGNGSSYYDIKSGTFTQFDDGTATLVGTAMNPYNTLAVINLQFDDFQSTDNNPVNIDYKQQGGLPYDENLHDFYTKISGSITIDGQEINIGHFVGDTSFQLGLGANAKSMTEDGGSAWIQELIAAQPKKKKGKKKKTPIIKLMGADHWDLNLKFIKTNTTTTQGSVPEPTSMIVFGAALVAGLVPRRRLRVK